LLRGGFDMAIYICTATPYDGSLSGARITEAKSWGKIKENADTVHVDMDASVGFTLLAPILMQ
jgi:deoxyhypusine synthase